MNAPKPGELKQFADMNENERDDFCRLHGLKNSGSNRPAAGRSGGLKQFGDMTDAEKADFRRLHGLKQ